MWDPFEQTVKTFGQNNLIRANPKAVRKLKIPKRSKKFLIEIGLPKEKILLCEFDLNLDEFPTIQEYAQKNNRSIQCDRLFRRIGYDGGTHICISEENESGEIFVVDLKGELPTAFVNSNIETFAGFLALYVEACRNYGEVTESEMIDGAHEFDKKLRDLDPPAFRDEETWWSCITEQLKCGML